MSENKTVKIYVHESDPLEAGIARAWAIKNDPGAISEGRVVDKVKLSKLAPAHVLVPIVREEGCSPAQTVERDQFGKRVQVKNAPVATLAAEVVPRTPIPVKNHWVLAPNASAQADIFSNSLSGDVNLDTLFDALALVCQPCTPRREVGEPDILRLRRI
jgi:hypothetical protein